MTWKSYRGTWRGAPSPRRAEPGSRRNTATADAAPAIGACACGGNCPRCKAKAQDSAEAQEGGAGLDPALRSPMESFFGQSLHDVRVHSDTASKGLADSLGAYAATYGHDIHLGPRGQALSGAPRAALLAHEVAHTLQQPEAATAPSLDRPVESEHSGEERHADALSHAFMASRSGYPAGLAVRDSIGSRRVASPRLQLARYATHFGEFEDYKYNEVKDSAGDSIGVQMYLKFHPGNNVDASKIGLTQAAEGMLGGNQVNQGFYGRRQATSGAGTGYFIDNFAGFPSPMYGTPQTPTAGKDAGKLGSYAAPGINSVTPKQLKAAGFNVSGIDYGGGSVYGHRFIDSAGKLQGPVPAELHDAPHIPSTSSSSEQVFETAALAFEGKMSGTYLGSVEWGWRRDAAGVFAPIPVAMKSKGVPSANFLTAANIWNTMKSDFGWLANVAPTSILKQDLSPDFTVPLGTPLRQLATASSGGINYLLVDIVDGTGRQGVVATTDVVMGDFGAETVDLPVPDVYTVNVSGGVTLDGETQCSPSDPTLPSGARVRILGPFGAPVPGSLSGGSIPLAVSPYVRVEVVDGDFTGRRGVLRRSDLTRETLGTR